MFSYKKENLTYLKQDFNNQVETELDKKLEFAFSEAMELGMLRYKQPKDANQLKVYLHVYTL